MNIQVRGVLIRLLLCCIDTEQILKTFLHVKIHTAVRFYVVVRIFSNPFDRASVLFCLIGCIVALIGNHVDSWIARKGQELREMTRDLDLLKRDPKILKTTPCKGAGGRLGCFESELTRRANHGHSFIIPQSLGARRSALAGASVAIAGEKS